MSHLRNLLVTLLGWINFLIVFVLLFIVLWQVFSRYVLNDPSTVSEELARILLMCLGPLGAAYALAFKEHMAIDLLSHKVSESKRKIIQTAISIFCGLFSVILLKGGIEIVQSALTMKQKTAALGLPMGYIYLAVPIGAAFMLIFLIIDTISGEEVNHG